MRGTAYTVTSSDLSSMPIEEFRTTLTRMFFLADGKPRICGGGHWDVCVTKRDLKPFLDAIRHGNTVDAAQMCAVVAEVFGARCQKIHEEVTQAKATTGRVTYKTLLMLVDTAKLCPLLRYAVSSGFDRATLHTAKLRQTAAVLRAGAATICKSKRKKVAEAADHITELNTALQQLDPALVQADDATDAAADRGQAGDAAEQEDRIVRLDPPEYTESGREIFLRNGEQRVVVASNGAWMCLRYHLWQVDMVSGE